MPLFRTHNIVIKETSCVDCVLPHKYKKDYVRFFSTRGITFLRMTSFLWFLQRIVLCVTAGLRRHHMADVPCLPYAPATSERRNVIISMERNSPQRASSVARKSLSRFHPVYNVPINPEGSRPRRFV